MNKTSVRKKARKRPKSPTKASLQAKKAKTKTPSSPSGEDQRKRLLAQVKKLWADYKPREKKNTRKLALALIELHKLYAKPGHGTFGKCLKKMGIPDTSAYRWMELHGGRKFGHKKQSNAKKRDTNRKKDTKQDTQPNQAAPREVIVKVKVKEVKDYDTLTLTATDYFDRLAEANEDWRRDLNAFIAALKRWEATKLNGAEKKTPPIPLQEVAA